MDGSQFDRLTRNLSSRRTALGGLLAGLLLPLEASARKKGKGKPRKGKGKGKGKGKQRATAQADACWRAGSCLPKKGSNVSQCDLANYSPTMTLDCTGCNISRANLRGANLSGANLTKANLSGSCLVDANLSGATVTNATNLYNAIFCRTTMPDGSVNNSGCGGSTPCCPTCIADRAPCGPGIGGSCCSGQCINGMCQICTPTTCAAQGRICGSLETCGTTLDCGSCSGGQACNLTTGQCQCPSGQALCNGACVNLQTNANNCGACGSVCSGGQTCSGGRCACSPSQTLCAGICVNTQFDNTHCGRCNNPCSAGQGLICISGTCQCVGGLRHCVGLDTCVPEDVFADLGCVCTGTC